MSTHSQEPSDRLIETTDFFAGGRKKREEMLAQPEDNCDTCKDYNCGESGCGDEGTEQLDADQDSLSTRINESSAN